jgi:hypothetical protein
MKRKIDERGIEKSSMSPQTFGRSGSLGDFFERAHIDRWILGRRKRTKHGERERRPSKSRAHPLKKARQPNETSLKPRQQPRAKHQPAHSTAKFDTADALVQPSISRAETLCLPPSIEQTMNGTANEMHVNQNTEKRKVSNRPKKAR